MASLRSRFLVSLALLACGACTFSRVESNERFRELDARPIVVGESTWRDVLNQLGTPSGASTEKITTGIPSMMTFRYNCMDEKSFSLLFSYFLKLPFQWSDRQIGHALIVEFAPDGTVSDIYAVGQEAAWRPFESEQPRRVEMHGHAREARP